MSETTEEFRLVIRFIEQHGEAGNIIMLLSILKDVVYISALLIFDDLTSYVSSQSKMGHLLKINHSHIIEGLKIMANAEEEFQSPDIFRLLDCK